MIRASWFSARLSSCNSIEADGLVFVPVKAAVVEHDISFCKMGELTVQLSYILTDHHILEFS